MAELDGDRTSTLLAQSCNSERFSRIRSSPNREPFLRNFLSRRLSTPSTSATESRGSSYTVQVRLPLTADKLRVHARSLGRRLLESNKRQIRLSMRLLTRDRPIQHQKIEIARQQAGALPALHRYGTARPWSVCLLAAAAAGGAMLLAGGLSVALRSPTVLARPDTPEVEPNLAPEIAPGPLPPRRGAARGPASIRASTTLLGWQIQVGAYRSPATARARLMTAQAASPELARLALAPQRSGNLTRARFVGIVQEAQARRLCASIARTGGSCFVVAPGG